MRIEDEGYEYEGLKLGQKVIANGLETRIIGFGNGWNGEGRNLAIVEIESDGSALKDSISAIVRLRECAYVSYEYYEFDEITLVGDEPDTSISPVHVLDILEDAIEQCIIDDLGYMNDIVSTMRECLKILRSRNYH